MNKRLNLFTTRFPYGKGETFVTPELFYLSKKIDSILLFPLKFVKSEINNKKIPNNTKVILFNEQIINRKILVKCVLKNLTLFIYILGNELFCDKLFFVKISNLKKLASKLAYSFVIAERIENKIKKDELFYSFWMNENALALSILKKKNKIQSFIFRVHGFDIYNERNPLGFIPFRNFNFKMVNKVLCVSKMHKEYLISNYPKFSKKYKISYLGSENHGFDMKRVSVNNELYKIVSCSNLIPLKRVELIAEALSLIVDINIEWTHFGDGITKNRIEEIIRTIPKNISVKLKGQLKHDEIFKMYASESYNLFINVSETEGLPVSIIEAISFGIPILATDVGGVNEIVTSTTGNLLSKDLNKFILMKSIKLFYFEKYFDSLIKKKAIQDFWKINFSNEINSEITYKIIVNDK